MIGIPRKKDSEAEKDITKQNQPVLVGFRTAYVFDRSSRDLRPARVCPANRTTPAPDVVLHKHSYIIAPFRRALQG